MKKILMLGTGGTIACKRGEYGLKPLISSDELLSYVLMIALCGVALIAFVGFKRRRLQK